MGDKSIPSGHVDVQEPEEIDCHPFVFRLSILGAEMMLTIQGTSQRVCNGLTRRDVIRAAGTGLLGTSLPTLLAAEEAGAVVAPRAKSVMFVFLFGGPSQLETFDMKPDAPQEIRGPYQPIASPTPGLRICEHLPKLAAMSDKYAVIRTMTHGQNDHNACHYSDRPRDAAGRTRPGERRMPPRKTGRRSGRSSSISISGPISAGRPISGATFRAMSICRTGWDTFRATTARGHPGDDRSHREALLQDRWPGTLHHVDPKQQRRDR